MDQSGAEGVRDISRRGQVEFASLPCPALARAARPHCKTDARDGIGRLRNCSVVLSFSGDAFRVVYAVQLGAEIWVVHAFQKKSTQGIKTPKREIDLIRNRLKRLKRLKEMLR